MQKTLCTSADCTSVVLRPPVRPGSTYVVSGVVSLAAQGPTLKPLKVLKSEGR